MSFCAHDIYCPGTGAYHEAATLPKDQLLVYRRKLTKASRSGHPGRRTRALGLLAEVEKRIEKEYAK